MDVVLKEDFPALGYVGDRVSVKAGYARNFLIPRGLAVEASSRNARTLQHRLAGIMARKQRLKTEAEEHARTVEAAALEFTLKIGEKGRSFGSISVRDILAALEEKGHVFDRRQIRLAEPIKSGGSFEVEVKLHSEVAARVAIEVKTEIVKAEKQTKGKKKNAEGGELTPEELDAAGLEDGDIAAAEDGAVSELEADVEDAEGQDETGADSESSSE